MADNVNSALNGFLAMLEDRPEDARKMFAPGFLRAGEIHTLVGRIQQARENIKCQAVRAAIRQVYEHTLRLQPPRGGSEIAGAYLEGVEAVEEILAEMLQACEQVEKKLGPNAANLPG